MKAGQNLTHVKPYFNDGIIKTGLSAGEMIYNFMNDQSKTKKSKNIARSSKKKRK